MSRGHKYRCAWGAYVEYLLQARGWSQAELAERLSQAQGVVSAYVSGRSKPPLGELSRWAEVLRCTHDEAERMCWLALEPWTPEPVWAKIRELESILADQEGVIARLTQQLADLRVQLGQRGTRAPSAS